MNQKDILNLSVEDFYNLVMDGGLSNIEQIKYIQNITDNYDLFLLENLLKDIEFCKYKDTMELEAELENQIPNLIKKYEEQGKNLTKIELGEDTLTLGKYEFKKISNELPIIAEYIDENGNRCRKFNFDLIKELRPYHFLLINRVINFINNKKKVAISSEVSHKKKTSYVWENNPDKQLPELYNLMVNKYSLILSTTSYEQFKAVFTGEPLELIVKIKKTKKFTNALLVYFVNKLFQKSNPNDYLNIAESCFDGARYLSQAQTNTFNNTERLPKNHKLIDDLLEDIKNTL